RRRVTDRQAHARADVSTDIPYLRQGVNAHMAPPTTTIESTESIKGTLIAQLRTVLDLTHTEIQVAETRVGQARTDAVRRELSQNAENAKIRAEAIEKTIRELGGFPDVIGPFLGRAAAA